MCRIKYELLLYYFLVVAAAAESRPEVVLITERMHTDGDAIITVYLNVVQRPMQWRNELSKTFVTIIIMNSAVFKILVSPYIILLPTPFV